MATGTTGRMTLADLRAAPPTIALPDANEVLGISRAHGYTLAKRGEYPVRVLKLGGTYRVVTAELLALLGAATEDSPGEKGAV